MLRRKIFLCSLLFGCLFAISANAGILVEFIVGPQRLTVGKSFELPVEITNGALTTFQGDISIDYYLENTENIQDPIRFGSSVSPVQIGAGQSTIARPNLILPAQTVEGLYYLYGCMNDCEVLFDYVWLDASGVFQNTIQILLLSGPLWEPKFPGSRSLEDLDPAFKANVTNFIAAVEAAGATVNVSSTYRPPERAYLMHWAWRIDKEHYPANSIPDMKGVYIDWWHESQKASEKAAADMVKAFGIDPKLKVPPALTSRHTERKAIDMSISWKKQLTVVDGNGRKRVIDKGPRDSTNAVLIDIGKTYGVIHFTAVERDPNHWSVDGR